MTYDKNTGGIKMRVLVVEDEKDLNKILSQKITKQNYSVDSCFDGEEAMDFLAMTDYDVVILDIMLPKEDGYEVLHYMRSNGINTPVIFLTAKDSIEDRVFGLDSGADDYIVKPFSLDEVMARIRVATRKKHNVSVNELVVDDLILNIDKHTVKRGDKPIELSPKEYSLLEYLMINRDIVLSREKIEDHIWNFDYEGGTNVVDVYIRYLRQKIDVGYERKYIHTVRGKGYVLR